MESQNVCHFCPLSLVPEEGRESMMADQQYINTKYVLNKYDKVFPKMNVNQKTI